MASVSLDKSKIRILLLEGVHPSAVDSLNASGYSNIEYIKGALGDAELKAKIADAHFVGIRSRTQLTADVLASANRLMAIGCFCIGTNQVDLKAATERGAVVFNAPYSNTRSVAELVIAEAIMLMRGVPEKNAKAHRGVWQKSAVGSFEVRGKTLGIVGYGNIGSQVSVLAESLGMKVKFYDVVTRLPLGNAEQIAELDDLLGCADMVSLHVPDTKATRNMMDSARLAAMKPGAVLINAARGQVIAIDALCEALTEKRLAGAAVDVFPSEPGTNQEEFLSPLRDFDNVILTPHVGGSTEEAQENIGGEVAEKLIRYSDNGTTLGSVNFPSVALPSHEGSHRLLHIHRNVPGIMSAINQVFTDSAVNITGQYLQTNEQIGYVVIDVAAGYSDQALTELKAIEGTIRCRVLF
ncbi:MAG: phosphoglycerate dehydrogenase [Candidatus Reddybacter sp.]